MKTALRMAEKTTSPNNNNVKSQLQTYSEEKLL